MLLTDFRFAISIDRQRMAAFLECVLPTIQWETQNIIEGGVNNYVHQLPTRRKETVITLKRGLGLGRELTDWYSATLQGRYWPRTISIHLMDSLRNDVITWTVAQAFPIKWTGPSLKSDGNAIAIESLELACGEISVTYTDKFPQSSGWLLQSAGNDNTTSLNSSIQNLLSGDFLNLTR